MISCGHGICGRVVGTERKVDKISLINDKQFCVSFQLEKSVFMDFERKLLEETSLNIRPGNKKQQSGNKYLVHSKPRYCKL